MQELPKLLPWGGVASRPPKPYCPQFIRLIALSRYPLYFLASVVASWWQYSLSSTPTCSWTVMAYGVCCVTTLSLRCETTSQVCSNTCWTRVYRHVMQCELYTYRVNWCYVIRMHVILVTSGSVYLWPFSVHNVHMLEFRIAVFGHCLNITWCHQKLDMCSKEMLFVIAIW